MPELPEVETVVRGLRGPLVGRTFTGVTVLWPKAVKTPSLPEFTRRLPGQRIEAISRRAKYLCFYLSGGDFLFLHLKMSGDLLVEPASDPPDPHVRTIFDLDNSHQLRFKDTRKFGRVYLVADPDTVVGKLGPEPLADDFTAADFKALFRRRKGRLKPLLLNQEFIAGIGNIYADESCFLAGLDPRRQVDTLTGEDLDKLYHAVRQALNRGIMFKGASLDEVYRGGEFQKHFQVYQRTGEACYRCGASIQRVVLGGRSTHFCEQCQK
ncbi:MAG: bifunctional DNA-formamidopyrimidine glycosylase/DNA-(apurinic or apyrimidinic site) lyase [Anaerolineae bacterium]|nr:bifunctional DNA-formamidopyrimidine glycosylase/DNA-(apurinic or apyrimidinic site) lyase [Anaerolineae bacterium]